MSRSGYIDDFDDQEGQWQLIRWRGAVASAIRGRRGQAFLREMLESIDRLPEPKLIAGDLQTPSGEVCAIGAVGRERGIDMTGLDPEEYDDVADAFDISPALAREIVYMNDEGGWAHASPRERWEYMRGWIINNLKGDL